MNLLLRRGFSVCSLLTLPVLLVGCGDELSCSTKETRQLVEQIVQSQINTSYRFRPSTVFSLDDIITTDKQKARTACKAKLHTTDSIEQNNLDITYTVEKTDDGRLYVTVFGL
jgi:hypothetical protein